MSSVTLRPGPVKGRSFRGFPRKYARASTAGFTLIEVLVVTTLVALAAGVMGACFVAGIRAWECVGPGTERESQVALAMALLERDLMNGVLFPLLEFRGEATRLRFPGIARMGVAGRWAHGSAPDTVAYERLVAVEYAWDAKRQILVRAIQPFPFDEGDVSAPEPLLTQVQGVRFRFRPRAEHKAPGAETWVEEWFSRTNRPHMVRIELLVGTRDRVREYGRTWVLPADEPTREGAL